MSVKQFKKDENDLNLSAIEKNELEISEEEIKSEIDRAISNYIRPGVEEHGGSIEFCEYKDGVVYVAMGGACEGCESISATLKEGVEAILKLFVPGVQRVELIENQK